MRRRVAYLGVLLAFALILSYVEALLPVWSVVPGVKLGLANLAVVLTLYMYGWKEALLLNLMRVTLSGFMFGNLFMVLYSMSGAVCSFAVMCLCRRLGRFSILGVSMAGGVFHNTGQVAVAVFVTGTLGVAYYMPVLLISGMMTGLCIGILAKEMLRHTLRIIKKDGRRDDSVYKR